MLARTYQNLRGHQDTAALGPLNPKLRDLLDETRGVVTTYNQAIQGEGAELRRAVCALSQYSGSTYSTYIEDVSLSLPRACGAFQAVNVQVSQLRNQVGIVVEAARDRHQSLDSEANRIEVDLSSKQSEYSAVEEKLSQITTQISDKETAANQLEEAAHSAKRRARRKKKRGLFGSVAGVALAPFTGGLSLGLTVAGLGEIHSADEAFSKANDLRHQAQRQRSSLSDLNSKLDTCRQEKEGVACQLDGKKRELETVKSFLSSVQSVLTDLNSFEDILNQTVRNLQNMDTAIMTIKLQSDALLVLQSVFANHPVYQLPPTTWAIYRQHAEEWSVVTSFLDNNSAITI